MYFYLARFDNLDSINIMLKAYDFHVICYVCHNGIDKKTNLTLREHYHLILSSEQKYNKINFDLFINESTIFFKLANEKDCLFHYYYLINGHCNFEILEIDLNDIEQLELIKVVNNNAINVLNDMLKGMSHYALLEKYKDYYLKNYRNFKEIFELTKKGVI